VEKNSPHALHETNEDARWQSLHLLEKQVLTYLK